MPEVVTVRTPHGVKFVNADGELGVLSGKVDPVNTATPVIGHWIQRVHPARVLWHRDELKQRASYLGTRQHLTPFIIPHRFEGKSDPADLNRAKLGYGIGLNTAYLQEILGHLKASPAHYTWGKLAIPQVDKEGSKDTTSPPKGGAAELMWYNATGDNVSWKNFFEGKVLEWMLTSIGGLILIDSNRPAGVGRLNQGQASANGIRTSFKFIPMSWVEDFGRGPRGYRWIKIGETSDSREPEMATGEDGYAKQHVIYYLMGDGRTRIRRYDDKGNQIGTDVFQTVVDTDNKPILPIVEVKLGQHPDLDYLGSGLLMGLDDIVIDLFNLLTEIREAYRDAVFSFLAYRGDDADGVTQQLASGTRLVHVGADPHSTLERIAADGSEVTAGLSLLEVGVKNWALSAKRRASEVAAERSGVSLKAEFQLDLVPLMVSIAEVLDDLETSAMFIWAQMEGFTMKDANELKVEREKEFQMEQEASRISRIVSEFLGSIPGMPAALLEKLIMRWAESIEFLNLDEPVETGDGSKKTLREAIKEQATEIAEADQQARIRQNEFGILGNAAIGAEAGGSNNGGGDPAKKEEKSPREVRVTINRDKGKE